jgi:hypothetical protein
LKRFDNSAWKSTSHLKASNQEQCAFSGHLDDFKAKAFMIPSGMVKAAASETGDPFFRQPDARVTLSTAGTAELVASF